MSVILNRLFIVIVAFRLHSLSSFSLLIILCLGMKKINFSGGEPFIHKRGTFVGELVQYCKQELQLPSVTIVSNGSLVTEDWFRKYGTIM